MVKFKENDYRENESIIKTEKKDISLESQKNITNKYNQDSRRESVIAREIIENPELKMKISEDDLHAAMAKTSELPEDTLLILIDGFLNKLKEENVSEKLSKDNITINSNKNSLIENVNINSEKFINLFQIEVENKILKNFKIFLNKSLVNIARIAKKHQYLFKNNKNFWIELENEILERSESLNNEQITEIICSFAKSAVVEIKLFDEFEDLIIETTIPFSVFYKNIKIFLIKFLFMS
jgi:hypothetical protein